MGLALRSNHEPGPGSAAPMCNRPMRIPIRADPGLTIVRPVQMTFLGHFHPVQVHLPIGGLVLLGVLELVAGLTRWKDAAQSNRWLLGFIAITAIASAVCGWLLAPSNHYELNLLTWHRVLALYVTSGCLVTFLLLQRGMTKAYRYSLGCTLFLLALVSYAGNSLSHGNSFLSRHTPDSLRVWVGLNGCPPLQQPVFTAIIEPILQERCVSCHGVDKHKGDLRLDTIEELMRGGQDGPVIKRGHAEDSPLIRCLLSAPDADGHMPPEEQPQATPEEIALLTWWINAGAPVAEKVEELKPEPEIRRLMGAVSETDGPAK